MSCTGSSRCLGGLLRFAWMFLPPITGSRQLVAWSSLLLALPLLGWTLAVRDAETPYWVVLAAEVMRRVPIEANFKQQRDIFRLKHTWIMTAI